MDLQDSNRAALIREARQGRGSSLGRLLDSYRSYLLRVASRRLDPTMRVRLPPSDVVQGALLVAARDFPQFRGKTEEELRAWLLRIVSNQIVDGLRRFLDAEKRRVDREVPHGDSVLKRTLADEESPSQATSLQEEASRLLRAIEALPAELREVVQVRYMEGLTFEQIARRTNLPVTTCRRRWLEAVDAIRQKMGIVQ